ncbi:thioredoxin family protein [Cyanobium sp. Aljojuca 7D2]|uniref:thioredoxin family protein n=1 Tax=Cyanobium sp. Aljojuca 7D2 TaxID=2823698 RepID=UPI0020CC6A71|nr:thioredoxin family protein [Cyanobium sp. Aljojuca 7D2]MCP9890778.1 thioredoxin family protein [Cyanobium sp. Aljojuca 7D2]
MALTPSTMLPLGTPLPLELIRSELAAGSTQQVSGSPLDLQVLAAQPVLVLFLCAHCPFVKHIEPELTRLAGEHAGGAGVSGLQLIGISSNSTLTHPQDGPEGLQAQAAAHHWTFPYLFDADQALARAFQAACTPDLFLFGADHRLAYRGQLDDSRPGNDLPCNGRDLRAAIAAVLAGEPVPGEQRPAIGCNIKWHPERGPVVRAT